MPEVHPVTGAAGTLPELLDAAVRAWPDRVFLHCASERAAEDTRTFRQLRDGAAGVAAGLSRLGLRRGDRIALAAPNQAEWLELCFGALRLGLVVVTLNVRYRESELAYMLEQSGTRVLVSVARSGDTDLAAVHAALRPRLPGLEHVFHLGPGSDGPGWADLVADAAAAPEPVAVRPADPAVILYTSGTTGRPKGAVLTHGGLVAAARTQAARLGTGEHDVYSSAMPLNHVGGLSCAFGSALAGGSVLRLAPAFSPAGALRDIAEHGATVFSGVPTMWTLVLGHPDFPATDTSRVRVAVVGGSNADPALCAAMARGFPDATLVNLYGLSEVSGACVMSEPGDDLETVARTLGTPLDGVHTRLVGPDGAEVGAGEEGELLVRCPGAAAGYWRMPEESAEVFGADGWVATGDVMTREPDGHLVIRGRRKEMFLQGGYNVYPVEVENVLTAHPAVAMAAGIGVPDPVLGEVGRYYVVARPGAEPPDAGQLAAFCARRLADYKVPRQLVLVDELPTTPTGKVAKAELRAAHLAGQDAAGPTTTMED
jgi:acyl-CoA synthetase (AMP-forming)/AMP-acid ligase II